MLRPISGRKNRRRSCQIDTIPPAAAEAGVRKQLAEQNNVSESYVARSEKLIRALTPDKNRSFDFLARLRHGGTIKGACV